MLLLLINTSLMARSSSLLRSSQVSLSRIRQFINQLLNFQLLSSPLLHQANCLHALHKSIQQLNQQLKAENPDRQALQLIALQLQNDFALLRYLVFSDKDTAAKDSATSPIINPNPNPTPNPNHTSSAFTVP